MAEKEKDQLAEDSTAALALGISYGKYKALQREGMLPSPKRPMQPVYGGPRCIVCGDSLPKNRRKYCGRACEHVGSLLRAAEYRRNHHQ